MIHPKPYTQRIARKFPALFIILLDQSGSMQDTIQGLGVRKIDLATQAVNEVIYDMIDRSPTDNDNGRRRNYCYLSIIGYNDTVNHLLTKSGQPIDLPTLAEHPVGTKEVTMDVRDFSTGQYRKVRDMHQYWIEPHTNGNTHMDKAFEAALQIMEKWYSSPSEPRQIPRREGLAPIIIHITDGEHNGNRDPQPYIEYIRQQSTPHGEPLIFNCHFTSEITQPCVFPKSQEELPVSKFAPKLFEMSSIIPEPFLPDASLLTGYALSFGSRGFMFNSDAKLLINFLQFGTNVTGTTSGR